MTLVTTPTVLMDVLSRLVILIRKCHRIGQHVAHSQADMQRSVGDDWQTTTITPLDSMSLEKIGTNSKTDVDRDLLHLLRYLDIT